MRPEAVEQAGVAGEGPAELGGFEEFLGPDYGIFSSVVEKLGVERRGGIAVLTWGEKRVGVPLAKLEAKLGDALAVLGAAQLLQPARDRERLLRALCRHIRERLRATTVEEVLEGILSGEDFVNEVLFRAREQPEWWGVQERLKKRGGSTEWRNVFGNLPTRVKAQAVWEVLRRYFEFAAVTTEQGVEVYVVDGGRLVPAGPVLERVAGLLVGKGLAGPRILDALLLAAKSAPPLARGR